ncbi:MAG: CDGSH iron-sulfur domain-containing protein [Geminicoccaceae bacterium]|nr:CDGSH iron-sulfur domain-containing protein [Geminicoccaceae bacterium]
MTEPVIARKAPFKVAVDEGETYFWCACGRSSTQPFCDGSHKGTGITPIKHKAEKTGNLFFCGCKRTAGAPLCDGSHKAL